MSQLAILGGQKVRRKKFPPYAIIGVDEQRAVQKVLKSNILSKFLGCWDKDFYGGPQVRALEKEWAEHFGVKHAIAVNSCTSGLYCAVGATGVEPGDEIVVSPYTMSASATAALIFNAVPVFADIEEEFFCLDSKSIERRITSRTRAIIVVDIFGLPYDADAINTLAKKKGLVVIEDTAQAPGALYRKKYAGTLADIGVFSLNYHKHIHCGEGGIVVTDNDEFAERIRLIRNHAEAVVEEKETKYLVNMIGFNFRMTEIEAAISRCQLRKLHKLLSARQKNCAYLNQRLSEIPALLPAKVRAGSTHAYYVQPFIFKSDIAGISRERFVEAVCAELSPTTLREDEGVLISSGYVKPLYLQPMYQKKIAYGSKGFPFNFSTVSYQKGICPVTERMYERELFIHELMRPPMTRDDLNDVVEAFHKVWRYREDLYEKET